MKQKTTYTITHKEVIAEARQKFPEYNLATALTMYMALCQAILKNGGKESSNLYVKLRLTQLLLSAYNSLYALN